MVYNLPEDYLRRIESIHLALRIPANYGALRQLTPYFEASDLISVEGHERQHLLTPQAAPQWHAMKSAAANEGIELLLISGCRSVDPQHKTTKENPTKTTNPNTIPTRNAAPGVSQHHTGLAL